MKNPKWSNPKGKTVSKTGMKKGYWFLHGRLRNKMTFLGNNEKQAIKKADKMNKGRIDKGKLIKL